MKKIFSMFLILIMILPLFTANASESSCLIEFSGATPIYSLSGTHAFVSGHHNDNAPVTAVSGKNGWCLTPSNTYNTIYINLPDSYMNNLNGNQDVLMDVCFYDGASTDKGNKFCVFYDSQNHYNEDAGVITLGGSGMWKTHTFVLEKPRLCDIGTAPPRNISISVNSTYMGASAGDVVIASAEVYYGEERDLFFNIDSENVGNIFFNDEPVILDMMFENPHSLDHGELTAELTLVNQSTGLEYSAEKQFFIGNARAFNEQFDISELNLPFGIYDVSADIRKGNELVANDITMVSTINAKGSNEPSIDGINNSYLGINTHAARYSADTVRDLVYLADRSGVGYIRTTLSWESVEKSAGEYSVPVPSMTLLEEAKKRNIKITVVLGNRNAGVYPDYKPWRTGSTEEDFQNYLDKYSSYIEYAVTELSDYVESWEIYNEYTMDYPGYDSADTDIAMSAARDYSDILKVGYTTVKRAEPTAIVIGGAHAGNGAVDNFAGRLYDTFGAADYMDVHSFHAYCSGSDTSAEANAVTSYTNRFKEYSDSYGDKQQIYLDEFNFVTTGRLSVEEQALYNVRLLTKERYLGEIDRIYSYNLESSGYNLGDGYGFLVRPEDDYDYLAKAAAARPNYAAFSFMNKLLRLSYAVAFTEDANGNYIYEFYDNINERPVYVIWNKNNTSASALIETEDSELISYDMYGNELDSSYGTITVETGKKPVYVAGPEKSLHIGQDDENYKVSISGTGAAGQNISVVVLNKGTQESDFSSLGQILYTDQKTIDSEGSWGFTFKVTQGNGEYSILITVETGARFTYALSYNTGVLNIDYELNQEQGGVYSLASLADGNLDVNYRIDNPENKKTAFSVFGCLYKGDTLVKAVKSPESQLMETDLIKTGRFTVPDVKKSDIDKFQLIVLDGTDKLKPLVTKFVLE